MFKKNSLNWFVFAFAVLVLLIGLPHAARWLIPKHEKQNKKLFSRHSNPDAGEHSPVLDSQKPISQSAKHNYNETLRAWITEFSALETDSPRREELLQKGITLAKARRPVIEKLIRENPKLAVEQGLGFHEWSVLPEQIKSDVERPFSAAMDYSYYPNCSPFNVVSNSSVPRSVSYLAMPDGSDLRTYTYGRRLGVFSKRSLPVQGISLGNLVAMRDGALQIVEGTEFEAVQKILQNGQDDIKHSFLSGKPIEGGGVFALAGGKIYRFANKEEVQELEKNLAELDALPGPYAASSALAAPGGAQSSSTALNLHQMRAYAKAQASSWTETKKRLFMIRVDFPDKLGEPVSTQALQDSMDRASEEILKMSYGKTWVESAVSKNVYTLPKNSEDYDDDEDRLMLRDARNLFRTERYGQDASVNIGPESHTGTGSGEGLGDYDIVGIYFTNLGRRSEFGFVWGGRAWAEDLWIQGNNKVDLHLHEWGHNYCINHASLWKTSDGSIAGNGNTEEYGDPFDYMGDGPFPGAHFHPEAKSRLNWLTSSGWADVDVLGAGTYRLYRIDDPDKTSGLRGLRVASGGNGEANGYYWVGYRGAFEENASLSNGAYLIWQRPGGDRSWLLDTTPASSDGTEDSALALGRTFQDPLSNLTITPIAKGFNGSVSYIDVQVYFGMPAPPTSLTVTVVSAVQINLSWSPVPGAKEYYILRNGEQIATIPALTFTDTLELPTSYSYQDKTARPSKTYSYVVVTNSPLGSEESQPVIASTPASSAGVYIANFAMASDVGQILIKKTHGRKFTGSVVSPLGRSSFQGDFELNGDAVVSLRLHRGTLDLHLVESGLEDGKRDANDEIYISCVIKLDNNEIPLICRSTPRKDGASSPLSGMVLSTLLESRGASGISFGYGYASVKPGKDGGFRFVGALPDGTKLTGNMRAVEDGNGWWNLPVALSLGKAGFLHGQGQINATPNKGEPILESATAWTWSRPANSKGKSFVSGFEEKLDVRGYEWAWSKGTSALGGSSANFTLTLSAPEGVSLAENAAIQTGILTANNKVVWDQVPSKGFSIKIVSSTGIVSGKIPATQGGKSILLPYQGILFSEDLSFGAGTQLRGAGFISIQNSSGLLTIVAD
jgi:hypothetical protein